MIHMWLFPLPKIKPLKLNVDQMPQKYVSGPLVKQRDREREWEWETEIKWMGERGNGYEMEKVNNKLLYQQIGLQCNKYIVSKQWPMDLS